MDEQKKKSQKKRSVIPIYAIPMASRVAAIRREA